VTPAQTPVQRALLMARQQLGIERSDEQRRSPWTALRSGGFRWYFAGSVLSDFGTWLQNTAQVLLAYRLSHSVLTVGLVTCAQFSSPLVLGPWAGVLADRLGGRLTLLYTEVVSAVFAAVLAVLCFTGRLNEPWLVTGAIVSGLAFTFALPARNVTVRRLVDDPSMVRAAYAMDSVSYNVGRALAPPVCVLLIAPVGFGWAFGANAVSFALFAGVLLLAGAGRTEPERRSRVRDGFLIALRDRSIRRVLLMVAAVTVAADPILVLGPALARHAQHVSDAWSGGFIAALGAGSVLGSTLRPRHRTSLRLAAAILAVLGLCMAAFVLAPYAWLSVVFAFFAGAACLKANSATRALLASFAGPVREASVMAVWAIAWAGSKPFASLADGASAQVLGVRATGLLMTVPVLIPLVWLVAVLLLRMWRKRELAPALPPGPSRPTVPPAPAAGPARPRGRVHRAGNGAGYRIRHRGTRAPGTRAPGTWAPGTITVFWNVHC
jgi:MFS family permease